MECSNCGKPVGAADKFCPNCGTKVKRPGIEVEQKAGTVKGSMTGTVLGQGALDKGIDSSTSQTVDTIESGGAMVGTIVGEKDSPVHVGGQQSYGDTVHGDKQEINAGGDYVGGDKVGGDKVGGDKITAGNISGSNVAIGRGAYATSQQGLSGEEIAKLFAPLATAVQQAPPQSQQEAQDKLQQLEEEVGKGSDADDQRMAGLVDDLVKLVPSAVSAVVSIFATPVLGGIAGPVTGFVLNRLGAK